ncbi:MULTISPECIES: hypothetical protein [Acidianus]|uniref:DNA polymerase sliding clamp n=1 Tax=Candidatus Acidianus copahuensis TaxID=1160895 RepID=A0A031LNH7_9CREN|nr:MULTISPECIES: hypothetical protein [Acidianus]EZQ03099.1 DNA polymerase [Candidatus Acidianus copahuensis]NON62474.1 DNA polymerase sliding clamp [Acidianus sp. RZ1]
MPFKAIYNSVNDFYALLSSISKLTDTITINFTENGINSKYLTEDKVIMCIINIPKGVMDEYEIEKEVGIKLNLKDIKKLLSKAKSKNSRIEIEETDSGIKVVIRDERTKTRSNMYIKAEKTDVEGIKEPNVPLSTLAVMPERILKTVIDDALEISSEETTFSSEENGLSIIAEESGKSYIAKLVKDSPLLELNVEKPAKAVYGLEVLKTVASVSGITKNIKISFGENLPMRVENGTEGGPSLVFWVAPRAPK